MSSARKFKRGFLDGFYEIFQNDPYIVKMSGRTQQKEENGEETLDKRTLSVFVARKIRDNYMDVCASLSWERTKDPAKFIFEYLKNVESSAFFQRKQQDSLLNTVFNTVTLCDELCSARELFRIILQNIDDKQTPWELTYTPAQDRKGIKGFISALGELRAVSPKYEVPDADCLTEFELDTLEKRGDKYALLTEIKKILKRIEKETDPPAVNDFANERFILSRSLKLCFEHNGYGKAWWQRWFDILCFYIDEEALQIATTEAFIDLVIVNLFEQKQIEAKYRNMGDGRDLSQKPQTKNVFAQDITFKDVCETYYIHKLLLSMDKGTSENLKLEFETLLRYHAAYISTASTSRFPAETGRLFSGTTSATGKNTQRTKQLLAIFAFFYFYSTCQYGEDRKKALDDFKKFNRAARITVDEKDIFKDRDIFQNGFDVAQRAYLMAIHDCINAIQRDFLYIFETTQRIINAPTRDQSQQDKQSIKAKSVATYMKSSINKLTEIYKKESQRDADISLLKRNAENIIRVCEDYDLHIPDVLIENAMKAALKHEKEKEQGKEQPENGNEQEKPESIAQFFMNECLKSLEEKFNEAAENEFLCNQLLLRQDFASVRRLLFRFAKYNDFTNECVLDIDLLQMRNELLESIDDTLLRGNEELSNHSKYFFEWLSIETERPYSSYSLKFADEIFSACYKNFTQNLVGTNDSLCEVLPRITKYAKPAILEKNSENSYRFICDLDRLILMGVGFARKYDGDANIETAFKNIFEPHFNQYDTEHLDYYYDPFILFGTIVLSYLSDESRKELIRALCEYVRRGQEPRKRPLQECYILLLNNVLLQSHIFLSYYERKCIFDCIFATNMYPKQWQAYKILKSRSFYADYARQEYQYFLDGIVESPRFIYLAASEAPALPDEKANSGDIKFELEDNVVYTLNDYYHFCLRLQYLSWTKPKHAFRAEQIQTIVNIGDDILGCNVSETLSQWEDIDKKKFALGTQMLLMGVANLIRSNRLSCADARTIPYHLFHTKMVKLLVYSEYLQRSMNQDYQTYLKTSASVETAPPTTFWLLCGGLRYIGALWKDSQNIPDIKVKLEDNAILETFSHSLNDFAAKHLQRFYVMDHRLIDTCTDYFDQRSEEFEKSLHLMKDYDEKNYLDYDNTEKYLAQMSEKKLELSKES